MLFSPEMFRYYRCYSRQVYRYVFSAYRNRWLVGPPKEYFMISIHSPHGGGFGFRFEVFGWGLMLHKNSF